MAVKDNNIQYRFCVCAIFCYIMLNIFYDVAEEGIIASLLK